MKTLLLASLLLLACGGTVDAPDAAEPDAAPDAAEPDAAPDAGGPVCHIAPSTDVPCTPGVWFWTDDAGAEQSCESCPPGAACRIPGAVGVCQ